MFGEISIQGRQPEVYFGDMSGMQARWARMIAPPVISAMAMELDLDAGHGIYYKREPDRATVTWYEIPVIRGEGTNTIQVVLFRNASFDLVFREMNPAKIY